MVRTFSAPASNGAPGGRILSVVLSPSATLWFVTRIPTSSGLPSTLAAGPPPLLLMPRTSKVYRVLLVSPVTVWLVVVATLCGMRVQSGLQAPPRARTRYWYPVSSMSPYDAGSCHRSATSRSSSLAVRLRGLVGTASLSSIRTVADTGVPAVYRPSTSGATVNTASTAPAAAVLSLEWMVVANVLMSRAKEGGSEARSPALNVPDGAVTVTADPRGGWKVAKPRSRVISRWKPSPSLMVIALILVSDAADDALTAIVITGGASSSVSVRSTLPICVPRCVAVNAAVWVGA